MAIFKARYSGRCAMCHGAIAPGNMISWSRRHRGTVYHAACAPDRPPAYAQAEPKPQPEPEPPQPPAEAPPEPQPEPGPQSKPMPESSHGCDAAHAALHTRIDDVATRVGHLDDRVDDLSGRLDNRLEHITLRVNALSDELHAQRTVTVEIPARDERPAVTVEHAHHMLPRLLELVSSGYHVYLWGPPGSGKSAAAVQAAKALGRRYGYISLNPQTFESRLLGARTAGGDYVDTEFFRLYTEGGVFCIDELDNAHPSLLNTLNGMLESDADGNGRGAFPCGVVDRHREFVCVATGNTNGRGGDRQFPERRALDVAFAERFVFLYWPYDEALEQHLVTRENPAAMPWLEWVRRVRQHVADNGLRLVVSPRASIRGARLLRETDWSVRDIADAVLFKGFDADSVDAILTAHPLPER
jgi:cobaltochelatase CobS